MSSDVSLGYITFPDVASAERICRALVTERLVACANVFAPHASIYRWNDEVTTTAEVAALLKFTSGTREALARRVQELHPYDVPALVFVDVTGGLEPFLAWVRESSAAR